jgi:hypothetical protein
MAGFFYLKRNECPEIPDSAVLAATARWPL